MINRTEAQQSIQANKVQHLTESELMDVLECARKTSRRDHSLMLTMYWHGLRNQEVARLRLSDIDFTAGLVTVQRQKSSLKTTQPLVRMKGHPAKCELAALKTWLRERGEQVSEYVFTSNRDGSCLGQKQINRIFRKILRNGFTGPERTRRQANRRICMARARYETYERNSSCREGCIPAGD